jgi:lysyl-tRNA synthetase, class I
MYWADRVAKEIIDSGKFKPYWVDDMKTLSGFPTVGSLKGPLLHDMVFRALKYTNQEVTYTYIFNDFDAMDGLSEEFKEKFEKYMGFPLKTIPSPEEGFQNFADYFAADFSKIMEELGVKAKYLSSWDMYHTGKFDEVIRTALNNSEKIQDIYKKVSGSKKKDLGWLPLQVICQHCGKLGTTRVYEWDGKEVTYKCEPQLVKWAKGCGLEGKMSPFGGNGKLPWKVDWPAHWKVLGVTIEGAGKDHASAGGSRDIAVEICKEVFDYPEPFNLPYEFILIGGRKMSTSKGLGLKAREITGILPPEIARFLFARTDYKQQANFDPSGTMAIPDLFDEYDRCYQSYIDGSNEELARTFEMSQINNLPNREKVFLPRFRDVANFIQLGGNLEEKFEEIKGAKLTEVELNVLTERVKYAKIWLESYAPDDYKQTMVQEIPQQAKNLNRDQKRFLGKTIEILENETDSEKLQASLYNLTKELGVNPKDAFSAIYLVMSGKQFGPKAGVFLLQYPKEEVIKRLRSVAEK